MGACDPSLLGGGEATVKYHSSMSVLLTCEQAWGQRLVGSLTGAVASERVTEAPKGPLGADGNRAKECKGSKGA